MRHGSLTWHLNALGAVIYTFAVVNFCAAALDKEAVLHASLMVHSVYYFREPEIRRWTQPLLPVGVDVSVANVRPGEPLLHALRGLPSRAIDTQQS